MAIRLYITEQSVIKSKKEKRFFNEKYTFYSPKQNKN